MTTLRSQFLAGLKTRARPPAAEGVLDALLARMVQQGEAENPGIRIPPGDFVRFVAERVDPSQEVEAALAQLHAEDLYLTCACARGDGRAHTELDRRIQAAVPGAVARIRATDVFLQDVQQRLRDKLLVSQEGSAPKILDYRGRGKLVQWLRAAAVRVALNLIESEKPADSADMEGSPSLVAPGPDPELALVKSRYQQEFKEAFEHALSNMDARERNFLRLYFVQGLTVEQIGRIEGTHKSTISRWLTRAREKLLEDIRQRLTDRLKLSEAEFESMMGIVQSQLDLSLHRVLMDDEDAEGSSESGGED